jgi:transcriptional regulator with XRE-family HTH domain
MTKLGDELRAARENAGFTQEEIATQTGISRRMVSRYEKGNVVPSQKWVARFQKIVKCDIELPKTLADLSRAEWEYLYQVYKSTRKIAELLGTHCSTVWRHLVKHGIPVDASNANHIKTWQIETAEGTLILKNLSRFCRETDRNLPHVYDQIYSHGGYRDANITITRRTFSTDVIESDPTAGTNENRSDAR